MQIYRFWLFIILSSLSIQASKEIVPRDKYGNELIPLEVIHHCSLTNAQISPNGKYLTYAGGGKIVIRDNTELTTSFLLNLTDLSDNFFEWYSDSAAIYYYKIDDSENFIEFYSLSIKTKHKSLVAKLYKKIKSIFFSNRDIALIICASNDVNSEEAFFLDLKSGITTQIDLNLEKKSLIALAENFQLSADSSHDEFYTLICRKNGNEPWKEIIKSDYLSTAYNCPRFLCFNEDLQSAYFLDSSRSNTTNLVRINTVTKEREIILNHKKYDVSDAVIHPVKNIPVLATINGPRPELIALDEQYKAHLNDINAHFKGCNYNHANGTVRILSTDAKFNTWFVEYENDNCAINYALYDCSEQKIMYEFSPNRDIQNLSFFKEHFCIQARDGQDIEYYLTRPTKFGKTGTTNMPTVVLVHGGPTNRDIGGQYNSLVAFIVSRGYACLQVNFRGSKGFGKAFMQAGFKEWGKKMQHDITDAVQHIIKQGIANPKKIAIMGISYGGYAALAGATFTPDLYCCAINICGDSNLISLFENLSERSYRWWSMLIGDPKLDYELLKAASPIFHVQNIKIPLLIIHGTDDPIVNFSQSEQLIPELTKYNKKFKFIKLTDEGHSFSWEKYIQSCREVESFLAEHLGGGDSRSDIVKKIAQKYKTNQIQA